jgi:hypothetical protein
MTLKMKQIKKHIAMLFKLIILMFIFIYTTSYASMNHKFPRKLFITAQNSFKMFVSDNVHDRS